VRRRLGNICAAMAVTAVLAGPGAVAAYAQSLSRVSLDSVGAVDLFGGEGTTGNPDASVDISSVFRLSDSLSLHVRPWFFKSSSNGSTWSKELYEAAVEYERPGPVSLRVEGGYITSPIGLGILDMRADTNPTIQPHLSYYVPLLPFDRTAPGVGPITNSYPLGVNVTTSTAHWDLRGAVVNAAPTRRYAVNNARGNPDATPVAIGGGGITLIPGLRIGTSFAAGHYATADEVSDPAKAPRQLTMWTAEGEYAFGYTKIAAEFTREMFSHGNATDRSSTWFVQGMHTLSPRWFVAGRHEAISAPPMVFGGPGAPRLAFRTSEGTAGYRLTRDFTLRASVVAARFYTATTTDNRVGVQIVWARRWW
jgi:hypothetical protein